LLLDEPTNDLDIGTLTVLESYLDEFPGVVFVVSHDRYFLDRTVDKIMAFEGKGNIAVHVGDYSDYEERMQAAVKEKEATQKMEASTKTPKVDTSSASGISTAKLKFSFNEQREYELIDEQIEQAEQKIALIGQNMELAASDAMELSRLMGELSQAEVELEHLMERWTYLNELAEQIEQQKKQ
jgi:ATP-binding cassette subfamily F protein uup